MTQSRYVCGECRRQWVYAQKWEPGGNCPGCGSQQVSLVTYTPAFPGADFSPGHRDPQPVVEVPIVSEFQRSGTIAIIEERRISAGQLAAAMEALN